MTDPRKLPAIYIKETRLVSQSFIQRKEFLPQLLLRSGPTARLPDLLPLGGFVRTTPKPSPLVETGKQPWQRRHRGLDCPRPVPRITRR